MDLKDFEIMAPVGSRESLAAAIQAGADSIYFGIENLNMRARSANTFTIEDLREIAQTCDEHDMKSYLTVNTIIYDQDLALMRTIVDAGQVGGYLCGDCGGRSCDELCAADRSGGTSQYATEYLECGGPALLRTICRCCGTGTRVESGTGSGDLSSYLRGEYLWSRRKAYSYRNVLSRCSLYGSVGKMLSFSARDEPLCQPGCLHAGVPSLLHGA